jgi:hypothetical protein
MIYRLSPYFLILLHYLSFLLLLFFSSSIPRSLPHRTPSHIPSPPLDSRYSFSLNAFIIALDLKTIKEGEQFDDLISSWNIRGLLGRKIRKIWVRKESEKRRQDERSVKTRVWREEEIVSSNRIGIFVLVLYLLLKYFLSCLSLLFFICPFRYLFSVVEWYHFLFRSSFVFWRRKE